MPENAAETRRHIETKRREIDEAERSYLVQLEQAQHSFDEEIERARRDFSEEMAKARADLDEVERGLDERDAGKTE